MKKPPKVREGEHNYIKTTTFNLLSKRLSSEQKIGICGHSFRSELPSNIYLLSNKICSMAKKIIIMDVIPMADTSCFGCTREKSMWEDWSHGLDPKEKYLLLSKHLDHQLEQLRSLHQSMLWKYNIFADWWQYCRGSHRLQILLKYLPSTPMPETERNVTSNFNVGRLKSTTKYDMNLWNY